MSYSIDLQDLAVITAAGPPTAASGFSATTDRIRVSVLLELVGTEHISEWFMMQSTSYQTSVSSPLLCLAVSPRFLRRGEPMESRTWSAWASVPVRWSLMAPPDVVHECLSLPMPRHISALGWRAFWFSDSNGDPVPYMVFGRRVVGLSADQVRPLRLRCYDYDNSAMLR